jgi:hypothetical protein
MSKIIHAKATVQLTRNYQEEIEHTPPLGAIRGIQEWVIRSSEMRSTESTWIPFEILF